eukprot:scaffold114410_cov36-Phaeocystis_antarctica.AAC.2
MEPPGLDAAGIDSAADDESQLLLDRSDPTARGEPTTRGEPTARSDPDPHKVTLAKLLDRNEVRVCRSRPMSATSAGTLSPAPSAREDEGELQALTLVTAPCP